MNTAPSSIILVALSRLLKADRPLRESIQNYCIRSSVLIIEAQPKMAATIYKKIYRLARLLWLCGHSAKHILIDGAPISIQNLLLQQPALTANPEGTFDKKLRMIQTHQTAQRYRALLGYASSNATVFIIGTDGVYKDVSIQAGVKSKIAPEDMLGRSLFAVLPSEETALFVLAQINGAYAEGKPRTIEYGLWDRTYRTEIFPIPDCAEAVLICCRTS